MYPEGHSTEQIKRLVKSELTLPPSVPFQGTSSHFVTPFRGSLLAPVLHRSLEGVNGFLPEKRYHPYYDMKWDSASTVRKKTEGRGVGQTISPDLTGTSRRQSLKGISRKQPLKPPVTDGRRNTSSAPPQVDMNEKTSRESPLVTIG